LALHLERRASGHDALIKDTAALASRGLMWVDRGRLLPRAAYPSWAGARVEADASAAPSGRGRAVLVATAADALAAFERAEAGDTGTELEFVIMVIAVSCVKLLSAHNSTQHTSRKHKV
jgi:hypothetical protein